jgi:hypothetical protein
LANFMRLSLMKAARVGGAPWQEIRIRGPITIFFERYDSITLSNCAVKQW